uniref:Uncharacterized protein n=1 Tax=Ditylenchus dipsaci TaxID=166011 RepID=A0A915DE56_9BILA
MALEAGFFYLPMIFWSQTNGKSGINIANMVKTVEGIDSSESAERKKAVLAICQHLEDSVRLRHVRRAGASKMDYYWKLGMLDGNFVSKAQTQLKHVFCGPTIRRSLSSAGSLQHRPNGSGHSSFSYTEALCITNNSKMPLRRPTPSTTTLGTEIWCLWKWRLNLQGSCPNTWAPVYMLKWYSYHQWMGIGACPKESSLTIPIPV